ncbi:MAG TPA: hypothetical protein PLV92_15985 [Pirellulaceae bacterium]|nr:hypothetical protein [Pirellulaceae bacterium]
MNDGRLRAISWRDLCPWLLIAQACRRAISIPLILVGTLGVILTPVGWRCAEFAFVSDELRESSAEFSELVERHGRWNRPLIGGVGERPAVEQGTLDRGPLEKPSLLGFDWQSVVRGHVTSVHSQLVEPFRRLFALGPLRAGQAAYLLAGGVWTLLVWALLGGAISRIAVLRLGREEHVGLGDALSFAVRRLRSYFVAPLFPLGAVALLAVPCALLGLLMRTDVGVLIGGALWPLVLIAGLLFTPLVLGAAFGWPLMWGAISAEENGDEFEALHRSYSYIHGRPGRFLFYLVVAILLGSVASVVVDMLLATLRHMTVWSVSWGAGAARWQELVTSVQSGQASTSATVGMGLIGFFQGLISLAASGFRHTLFWYVAASIYLVLRLDVDETELRDVYVDEAPQAEGPPQL